MRNGVNSWLAMASGYVEWTRTLDGGFTPAYFGHTGTVMASDDLGEVAPRYRAVTGRLGSFQATSDRTGWVEARAIDLHTLEMARMNGRLRAKVKAACALPGDRVFAALNVLDLWVQSPAACLGWSDAQSRGYGYIPRPSVAQARVDAFFSSRGILESSMSLRELKADQARRSCKLAEWLDHWRSRDPALHEGYPPA